MSLAKSSQTAKYSRRNGASHHHDMLLIYMKM